MPIRDKEMLRQWIEADFLSYRMKHPVAARLTYGENWELFSFMKNLRYLEYYSNKLKKTPWDRMMLFFFWLKHRRNCKKNGLFININSVGPGFHLQHRGYRHINSNTRIGANCTILPMVLIGNKRPDLQGKPIIIGDNCYISTGVTILGPVIIGNNVTIGAGAVVTKNIADNSIVGGIPAKPINEICDNIL